MAQQQWRMDVQRQRYGAHLYVKDEEGLYVCFFKGCGQKYKSNFSRHVEGHENRHDAIDEEFASRQLQKFKDNPDLAAGPKPRARVSRRKATVPLSRCKKILDNIKAREAAIPFSEPVDPIKHGAANYFSIIEKPMDLRTVSEKLASSDPNVTYKTADDFAADMRLIWTNARKYNAPGSPLYNAASELGKIFDAKFEAARIAVQHQQNDTSLLQRFPGVDLSISQMVHLFDTIQNDPHAWPFMEPVDPDRYELPDYLRIIKDPMDLTTVWNNMQAGKYSRSFVPFARDMRLIFRNAMVYNEPGCDIYEYAESLSATFEADLENQLAANYKASKSMEILYCFKDTCTKRVLFYDEEKGQYYFEFFDNEDEALLMDLDKRDSLPPPPKRRKMGDNPDPAIVAALNRDERAVNQKRDATTLARITENMWACYRPKGTNIRQIGVSERRRRNPTAATPSQAQTSGSERKRVRPQPKRAVAPATPSAAVELVSASEPSTPMPVTPGGNGLAAGVQTPVPGANGAGDGYTTPRPATPFTPMYSAADEDEMDEDVDISAVSPVAEQSTYSSYATPHQQQYQPQTPTTQMQQQQFNNTQFYQPAAQQQPQQQTQYATPQPQRVQPPSNFVSPGAAFDAEVDEDPFAQATVSPVDTNAPMSGTIVDVLPTSSPAPPVEANRQPLKFKISLSGMSQTRPAPAPQSALDFN